MSKPDYYLWKDKETNDIEFNKLKQKYMSAGFNVIVYNNTSDNKDIKTGLYSMIKNHCMER